MITLQKNISLQPHNSFGIAVNAKLFVVAKSENDLREIYSSNHFGNERKLVMGSGTNILFTKDFDGLIVKNEIGGIALVSEDEDEILIRAGSGVNWHEFVLYCIGQGWGGIENLSLIPGTVGAAPVQNIGAYGVELKDVLHTVRAWDMDTNEFVELYRDQCDFGYRSSIFKAKRKGRMVISSVVFRLTKKHVLKLSYGAIKEALLVMGIASPSIRDVSNAVISIRSSKLPDPVKLGNAGSFFKNPAVDKTMLASVQSAYPNVVAFPFGEGFKLAAGWLIESAGWKGYRKGNVGCYEKQSLVLVNFGNATGEEILAFSRKIQASVWEKFGIELEPEVNIV